MIEPNVLRLGDVQPCSKFNFSTNVIGCILPNRCYLLGGFLAGILIKNEMKNITKIKDLRGKTIVDTKTYCGDLWLKFSDDSFAVLVVNDITESFGYRKEEVNLYQYGKDKTEYTLVKLGLITEQEYKNACDEEEKERQKRQQEREEKERKRVEEYELEQLKKLSDKYKT